LKSEAAGAKPGLASSDSIFLNEGYINLGLVFCTEVKVFFKTLFEVINWIVTGDPRTESDPAM
jgi:hypothetical protein